MKQLEIILRRERVEELTRALRGAGIPRLTLCHVHSIGCGVDPERYRLAMEEGTAYTEKARLELVCQDDEVENIIALIRAHARTGHRGDGVVIVRDVETVASIRTDDQGVLALL